MNREDMMTHELTVDLESKVAERMQRAKDFVVVHRGSPVITPKWLIDQPIWHEPERAARFSNSRAVYYEAPHPGQPQPVRIVVETNNDLKITGTRFCSGGLLRWKDMDIAVAASREWAKSGTRFLECYQADLLAWIGYDESVPHRDVQGSLDRLRRTGIALYFDGEECRPSDWFTIFSECSSENRGKFQGNPTVIRAQLSRPWLEAFTSLSEWTVFDLECYAHLARANRRLGLARALYLYFASKRNYGDLSFSVHSREVIDRFSDKSLITRRPIFHNPWDERSKLYRAMRFLNVEGVIEWKGDVGEHLVSGVFVRPKSIIALDDYSRGLNPRRRRRPENSIPPDFSLGVKKLSRGELTVETSTEIRIKSRKPISEAIMSLAARAIPKIFPSINQAEILSAVEAGWTKEQLGHLLGYTLWFEDRLKRPIAFLVAELKKGNRSEEIRLNRWCKSGIQTELREDTYEDWADWSRRQMEQALEMHPKGTSSPKDPS